MTMTLAAAAPNARLRWTIFPQLSDQTIAPPSRARPAWTALLLCAASLRASRAAPYLRYPTPRALP